MPRRKPDRRLEGIEVRHQDHCSAPDGDCSCRPTYRASVWDPRDRRLIRRRFSTLAAAKGWRVDAQAAVRRGELRGDLGPTLREAADSWVKGAEDGSIRNRSGDRYKPSAVRGYEQALRLRLVPALGGVRLGGLQRADVQALVDRLLRDGHEPATIRNTLLPLRAICRRAVARGEIAINPTTGLELPSVPGRVWWRRSRRRAGAWCRSRRCSCVTCASSGRTVPAGSSLGVRTGARSRRRRSCCGPRRPGLRRGWSG